MLTFCCCLAHTPLQRGNSQSGNPPIKCLLFFINNDLILLAGKIKQVFPMAKGFSYTAVVPFIFNQKKKKITHREG